MVTGTMSVTGGAKGADGNGGGADTAQGGGGAGGSASFTAAILSAPTINITQPANGGAVNVNVSSTLKVSDNTVITVNGPATVTIGGVEIQSGKTLIINKINGGATNLTIPWAEHTVTRHFGTFSGSGNLAGRIDGPLPALPSFKDFDELILMPGGNVVAPSNYAVTQGSTIITLDESYLKTLANGTYTFYAKFSGTSAGYALLNLTVARGGISPKTGYDAGSLPLLSLQERALFSTALLAEGDEAIQDTQGRFDMSAFLIIIIAVCAATALFLIAPFVAVYLGRRAAKAK
jgi:hypothetical protein